MPAEAPTELVIGAGKVFFDPFLENTFTKTGEVYIGNTPDLAVSVSNTDVDHYDSDNGTKTMDASVTLSTDETGSFSTDNLNAANLAMFFQGAADTQTIVAAASVIENITVRRGRWYQLGASDSVPQGTRDITLTTVKIGAAAVANAANVNYEIDIERARIYIQPAAPGIPDGTTLEITYAQVATTVERVIAKGTQILGALRFIADNRHGADRDYYWPYVKISPDGDLALKGDDFIKGVFNLKIMKLKPGVERQYVTGRPT